MARYLQPLNANTIGDLLQAVEANGYRTIDLSAYDFVDVYASVVLALLLRFACTTKAPPGLVLPESDDVKAYLARQEFFRSLEPWYKVDPELKQLEARQWGDNPRVAPLTLVDSEDSVTGIVDRIRALLCSPAFGVSEAVADGAWRVLSETLQNIPQHAAAGASSGETGSGFAALQLYRDALEVAVGDIGVGLGDSLRQNRKYRNCTDAQVQEAVLVKGATRTDNPGRGNGLQITAQTVSKLRGVVVLQSGNTVTFYSRDNYRQRSCTVFRGTQLRIRIPCQP